MQERGTGKGSASATRYLSTVFRGAYSRARFREPQLIGLINERSCQRPGVIIRDSLSLFPPARRFYLTAVTVFGEERRTLYRSLFLERQEIGRKALRAQRKKRIES